MAKSSESISSSWIEIEETQTTQTQISRKRKAFILPGFCSWSSKALAELCGEFSVPVQGLRKDQLIDILFEIDNAATFGAECKSSPLGFEDLLAVCVKARVRYFRQKKALSSDQFPSFEGLWHDLTFLNSSSSPKTSQGLQ